MLHPLSRAYDPTYQPTKALSNLVEDNPQNQFLQQMLQGQHAALKEQEAEQDNRAASPLPKPAAPPSTA